MVVPDHPALRALVQDSESKLGRGLQNDVTAEMLSSVDWDWKDPLYVTSLSALLFLSR